MSWKRLDDVLKTSSEGGDERRLLKMKTKDVFKTSSKRLHQDEYLLGNYQSDHGFWLLKWNPYTSENVKMPGTFFGFGPIGPRLRPLPWTLSPFCIWIGIVVELGLISIRHLMLMKNPVKNMLYKWIILKLWFRNCLQALCQIWLFYIFKAYEQARSHLIWNWMLINNLTINNTQK